MCKKNLVFWCCALFVLVVMSSKTQQNFTGNEEKNNHLTIQYEIDADSTTNYGDEMKTRLFDLYEKTTNNTQYEDMQYKSRTVSTSNDRENDDWKQFIAIQEFYENLMRIEDKNNSMINTSHKLFGNSSKNSNTSYIIPDEICYNITCIQLCCPLSYRLVNDDKFISEKDKYIFPNVYEYMNDSLQSINKTMDELFPLVAPSNLCQNDNYSYLGELLEYRDKNYTVLTNGSIYLCYYKIFLNPTTYCLAAMEEDKYEVSVCKKIFDEEINKTSNVSESYSGYFKYIYGHFYNYAYFNNYFDWYYYAYVNKYVYEHVYKHAYEVVNSHTNIFVSCYILSIPFLVSIFVVYSILPELRNVHGFMLRNYSGALSVAYIIDFIPILFAVNDVHLLVCITIDFFNNFFFLTSFFWLSIMSFDTWWTFRGFCSLQRNVKQREKKRLVFYSIFAWGLSFTFAIISVIMNVSSKSFRKTYCKFAGEGAFLLNYYIIQSICIISSICLSISTALKIAHYEKEIANHLTDSESKRYNNNKKWSNQYLKLFILLFILMGIKWSIMTISLLYTYTSLSKLFPEYENYFIYIILLVDILQNICTFIVFVWKKEIKRMLLKRFCGLFRCATNATSPSTESTCTTTLEEMPMQKRMSSGEQRICHEKDS